MAKKKSKAQAVAAEEASPTADAPAEETAPAVEIQSPAPDAVSAPTSEEGSDKRDVDLPPQATVSHAPAEATKEPEVQDSTDAAPRLEAKQSPETHQPIAQHSDPPQGLDEGTTLPPAPTEPQITSQAEGGAPSVGTSSEPPQVVVNEPESEPEAVHKSGPSLTPRHYPHVSVQPPRTMQPSTTEEELERERRVAETAFDNQSQSTTSSRSPSVATPSPTGSAFSTPFRSHRRFSGFQQGGNAKAQHARSFHNEARSTAHAICHRIQQIEVSLAKGCKTQETIGRIPSFLSTLTALDDAFVSLSQAEVMAADIPKVVSASQEKLSVIEQSAAIVKKAKNDIFVAMQQGL